jgi:hypothetical protein
MSDNSFSRRAILTSLPAAAIGIGALGGAVFAAASDPDAELVALVRKAMAADDLYGDLSSRCDSVRAQNEGYTITAEDEAALDAAGDAYNKLRVEIFSSRPVTVLGIRAIFEFLKSDPYISDVEDFADNMLACPGLAMGGAHV